MRFELHPDTQLLVETTEKHLESLGGTRPLRELNSRGQSFDRAVWEKGAELGWTALLVPEALGGGSVSGSGVHDLVVIAEALGRVAASTPLVPVSVVIDALVRSNARPDVVDALMSGRAIGAWLPAARDGDMVARREGAGWTIDGRRTHVIEADSADWLLVTAATDEGRRQFLVASGAAGVAVTPRRSIDLARGIADVAFNGVRVDDDAAVGGPADAATAIERQFQLAVTLLNAETAGALAAVFEMTLQYAGDRVAFGRPLASYQALKHRFANLKLCVEAAHATVEASTDALALGRDDAVRLVSVAAAYINARAPEFVQDCIQLHGGIGVTWEHDLHLYLRRVTQNAALLASVHDHRERVAASMATHG